MRKTKLFKRSAAVVISASMVLTSVNVIPELKEEAKAANATTRLQALILQIQILKKQMETEKLQV